MQPDLLVLCLTLLSGFVPYTDCSSSPSACAPVGAAVIRCVHELSAPDPSVIVQDSISVVAQATPRPPAVVRKPVTSALGAKAPVPTPPAPVAKRGTTPADAMDATDTWQEIGPKGQVWYKVGDPKLARVHLDVWLDAKGVDGMGFAIYAPDQMTDPISGPPKGQGTPNRKDNSHDLNWSGQAPAGGVWYIRVTNSNPVPIQYKLGTNLVFTGERANCTGPYWEWIGAHVNAWVLWPGYCP